jgi:hypothetical protein
MGLGRTAKYYRENPEARKKHRKTSAEAAAKPAAIKKRVEANKYNREKGTYGNGDGLDASHKGGKVVGLEKAKTNRARGGAKKQ